MRDIRKVTTKSISSSPIILESQELKNHKVTEVEETLSLRNQSKLC